MQPCTIKYTCVNKCRTVLWGLLNWSFRINTFAIRRIHTTRTEHSSSEAYWGFECLALGNYESLTYLRVVSKCSHASPLPLVTFIRESQSNCWHLTPWGRTYKFRPASGYGLVYVSCSPFITNHQIGVSTEPTDHETTADRWHKPTAAHQTKLGSRSQ